MQANEGLVLEALHSILYSADTYITPSLLPLPSSSSSSADHLERFLSITTDEVGRDTLSAPAPFSLFDFVIFIHVECSQLLYAHAESLGKTNRDTAILCYKQALHCLTPHLPSTPYLMHTHTYITTTLRKLIHLTRKNEPFESHFWSFLLSIVNNMVKEQVNDYRISPSTSYGEIRMNNPISTNSMESIISSDERGSKENVREKNATSSNGHGTSSKEHAIIEMKRMDSWDLLALEVNTEHHQQLDVLQRKIVELTKENGLLREEKERLKATTGSRSTICT